MPDTRFDDTLSDLPMAAPQKPRRWRPQFIWIIPILAALVGISLAVKVVLERGSTITITFKSGDGLEAGKTHVKYKDVDIGLVKKVVLSKDHQQVIATVQIDRDSADFLRDDTHFWIVRPRITASGVSGLGTLLVGSYIAADIGTASSMRENFVALDVPPILTRDTPGREFVLRAPTLGSHDVGTPLYFRRLAVGKVVSYELDKDGKGISIKVFVDAPYDQYVTSNTRFWNASGIDVSVGATGFKLQTESMISVLAGGIAFEAPQNMDEEVNSGINNPNQATSAAPKESIESPNIRAEADTVFPLFQTRELAMKRPDTHVQRFVINFKQSVRGLAVGAPVEFRGVNIGEVISIDTAIDPNTYEVVQPVGIFLYAERLNPRSLIDGMLVPTPKTPAEKIKRFKAFLKNGFRAQLRSGNLLTGQQYIALDFFPDAPKYTLDLSKRPLEMPSVPGTFDDMEKVVVNMVKKLDTETIPEFNKTLKNVNSITASDSPLQTDMRDSLRELTKAAASLKKLTDMLDQQPQSLIFGKSSEESK